MEDMANRKVVYEFGGPIGTFLFILFSHFLVYYFWLSITYYQGSLIYPRAWEDLSLIRQQLATGALPTLTAAGIYIGFFLIQFLFAMLLPGVKVKGLPIPSENNRQYTYLCNGFSAWYATLILVFLLNYFDIMPLTSLADHFGPILTVAVIVANLFSLWLFFSAYLFKKQIRMTGNFIYDFFMGASLNPRFLNVDFKFFIEIRISWILLFLLTLSAAAKQYQLTGTVTNAMWIMLIAHGLYTNACMKGEECIPTTWDVFYEKCGWMLVFWNLVGVPFVYCFQSYYILKNNVQLPTGLFIFVLLLLLGAYYVWDTANSQKNRFRMQQRGTYLPRKTFPQLPWGTLKNGSYLKTMSGSMLLTDGWYKYARKIHYTADFVMALCWALSCGFTGILPYFYPFFFLMMIMHRYYRDSQRCAKKYGEDWERYCKIVPYRFIPFVF